MKQNNNKKINKIFMAFATGKESVEGGSIKKYIGVAPVFILGVNPTKTQLEQFYGGNVTLQKEPEYVSIGEVGSEGNKKTVPQVRIDFVVKTDPEKCKGVEIINKMSFFLKQEYYFNGDKTKVQIIDKYGRTAWATAEEVKNKTIPIYTSGPANIDIDYRPAYIGEAELTEFIKVYLNIPGPQNYVKGVWVDKSPQEKADAEARLDGILNYFKGDVKELRTILSYQPNNKVKVMFGVKTTADNKQYQSIYTQKILRNGTTDYSKLDEDLQNRKKAGAFRDIEYAACEFGEYIVSSTNFETGFSADLPSGTGFFEN